MNRQNRVVSPSGTINRTIFDVRNLTISTWIGTNDRFATDADPTGGGAGAGGNNMVQISGMTYDGGAAGGDGNLTMLTAYVDASMMTIRVTTYTYDFRNRRIATDGEVDFYEELTYDNLNNVTQVDRYDTSASGHLIARNKTMFDNRGRTYQTIRYAVDPGSGSVGNSLVDNTWYDAAGNVLCSLLAGSNAFTKRVYDGIGRTIASYTGYNPDDEITPDSVADDLIFEQSETLYDAASNVIFSTLSQRWHNTMGAGPLNGPTGSQPNSRDSYGANWPDGLGRVVANANYGTNDNIGPSTRPATPPASSDLVLVSQTRYNERGEAFESEDAAGKVDRSYSDDAGRTIQTIQNVVLTENGCWLPGNNQNVTVEKRYAAGGQLVALIAKNPETGDQITALSIRRRLDE